METTTVREIKPFVRYARILNITPNSDLSFHAYDNRALYFFSGDAKVKINGKIYSANRGSFFFWSSDCSYSISQNGKSPMRIMFINFDFTQCAREHTIPLPTVSDAQYSSGKRLETVEFSDFTEFNQPLCLSGMQSLEKLLFDMADEFNAQQPCFREMLSSQMENLIVRIHRKIISASAEKSTGLVDDVTSYIQKNCGADLSNAALGALFNYHPNYINRVVQKYTGQSLHQYVLTHRVLKALELIQTTNMSITEISKIVGFSSVKHFSQSFKIIYGMSPIHFRQR